MNSHPAGNGTLGIELRRFTRVPTNGGLVGGIVCVLLGLPATALAHALWTDSASGTESDAKLITGLASLLMLSGFWLIARRIAAGRARRSVSIYERGIVFRKRGQEEAYAWSEVTSVTAKENYQRVLDELEVVTSRGTQVERGLSNLDHQGMDWIRAIRQGGAVTTTPIVEPVAFDVRFESKRGADVSPVLGQGRISLDASGLRVQGRRSARVLSVFAGAVAGVVGLALSVGLLTYFDVDTSRRIGMVAGIGGAILPGLLVGWMVAHVAIVKVDYILPRSALRLIELRPGWLHIRSVDLRAPGEIVCRSEVADAEHYMRTLAPLGAPG